MSMIITSELLRNRHEHSAKYDSALYVDLIISRENHMTEENIKLTLIAKAEVIAKALHKGCDVEIRKSANGITVAEVKKKVVAR